MKHFLFSIFILISELLLSQEKSEFYSREFSKLKPQNIPSGLLLGLRTSEGYRTLFIINKNGTSTVSIDLPYLATPQKDGFYFIDEELLDSSEVIVESVDSSNLDSILMGRSIHNLVVFKNAEQIKQFNKNKKNIVYSDWNIKCPSCKEGGGEENTESIEYVIPNYITVNYSGGGYYTGAAHPFHGSTSESMNFDWFRNQRQNNYSKRHSAFGLSDLYKKKSEFINQKLLEQAEDVTDGEGKASPLDLTDIYFALNRKNGEVHLSCFADAFVPYSVSGDYKFTADYDIGRLDKQYVPNNIFPLTYSLIGKQTDNYVKDILVSPSQDVVYLLVGYNEIRLIGVDVKSQKEIINLPLKDLGYTLPIMVEWSTGKHIENWEGTLAK